MSYNYGEIHMFDNVRKDMETPTKHVRTAEWSAPPPAKFPFTGRRHTVANVWAPFPDDKGGHAGNKTTTVTPPPPPPPMIPARRPSVADRMRQYMSPGNGNPVYNDSQPMLHYPSPFAHPCTQAIAVNIFSKAAMRGCRAGSVNVVPNCKSGS